MKNRIIILILVLNFAAAGPVNAGNRKANRYFELFRYSSAIPLYKKAATMGTGQAKREATIRLADCYRLTGDITEARAWYSKAIKYDNPDPMLFFYYGQALRSLGQYDEAKAAFLKFSELKPDDKRGKILAGFCDRIQSLPVLPATVRVENASILNSESADFCPVYYNNGIVFASDRKAGPLDELTYEWTNRGYLDLYFSRIQSDDDSWEAMTGPVNMSKEFNQQYHDGPVSFTADYSEAYLTRTLKSKMKKDENNIRTKLFELFHAYLTGSEKTIYIPLPFNNENYSTGHAAVSKDGTSLIFSSDMPGGYGGSDLYTAQIRGETWSQAMNMGPTINSFGNDVFPYQANDSTLYFASDGHLGYGGLDLYVSRFRNGQWCEPENMLKPVNSPYDDFGLVIREEKKMGFFSSDRPGGFGSDDIYAFGNYGKAIIEEAPLPLLLAQRVGGFVKEKQTGNPLDQATIFVLNPQTSDVSILKTNQNGYFEIPVQKDLLYVTKAMLPGYLDDCFTFRFIETDTAALLTTPRDLLLDKFSVNQVFELENIYYDLDKWFIREDAKPALDNLIRNMRQFPITIELSSHTDSRAPDAYNMVLSTRRAEAAVEYLTYNGIDPSRLKAKGYGETMLVNHCINGVRCSEEEHQANRRTEFRILSINSPEQQKGEFDPSLFTDGDVIPVQLLKPGFFTGCFQPVDNSGMSEESARLQPYNQTENKPDEPLLTEDKANPEETTSAAPVETETGNSWFTVQIFAVTTLSEARRLDFKGETPYSKPIDKYTKYFVGRFQDWRSANRERTRLNSKFPGCFVVGFKDGEVIHVNDLRKILGN